jgi:hypothetical protein
MIGRKARPCMNLHGMYNSAWFLKAWLCLSRFHFLVIFWAFSWWFCCGGFETFLFGIWWGMNAWTLHGSFPVDSPPKFVSKRAWFWGFLRFRVRDVLGGNPSIPLDLASIGGLNHGYGIPMRYSYYPQSLVRIRGANQEIGVWIWRSWPEGCCSSQEPRSWPVWSVVARVACSVEFSSRFSWLLVPRTSSTQVGVSSWPTWVIELEACFG